MKKAFVCALCALAVMGTLTGCGGTKKLYLRVGAPEESVWLVAAETFRENLKARTDGRYNVVVVAGTDGGRTDVELESVAKLAERAEGLSIVSVPWLFPDGYNSVDSLLLSEGPGQESVFSLIRSTGAEPLALGENGFLQFTSDVRPISVPSDLEGLKLRVPFDGPASSLLNFLGAETTALNESAAFSLLQDAELDGQAATLDAIRSSRSYLVQRYLTLWNCAYDPICLSVSGDVWGRLSEEDKTAFRTAAQEACTAEIAAARAMYEDTLTEFRESGTEVTELDTAQIAAFRTMAGPAWTECREELGDEAFAVFGYYF